LGSGSGQKGTTKSDIADREVGWISRKKYSHRGLKGRKLKRWGYAVNDEKERRGGGRLGSLVGGK